MNGKGALSTPAISLWPYKLVTALLSRVLELGGQLYTGTCVANVEEESGQTTLRTSRGILTAKKTVFATNAYTAALLPEYEGFITPVKGENSHLAPLPFFKPPISLENTYNLRFTAEYADYLVPRPDGTIILGGAKWTYDSNRDSWWNTVDDRTLIHDAATAHFDSVMARHYRGWENANAHHDMVWSGSKFSFIVQVLKLICSHGLYPRYIAPCGPSAGFEEPVDSGGIQWRWNADDLHDNPSHRPNA